MLCDKCQTEVPATARFCPSCGSQNAADTDIKAAQDVTLGWLETIYKETGYKTDIKDKLLYLRHDVKANMSVELKAGNRFIGVNSLWTLANPPSIVRRGTFAEALNKANARSFMVNFSTRPGKFDEVLTSSFMWIGGQISARDVADFTDTYAEQVSSLFEQSGLRAFA